MQAEFDLVDTTGRRIHLLGVNQPDKNSGNANMVLDRTIPWLQDTFAEDVASLLDADHFDLVIIGPQRSIVWTQNLSTTDLTDPEHYEELKARLEELARY